MVDREGNVLVVVVHEASLQDYHAARTVFTRLQQMPLPRLHKIWADAIYKGDKTLQAWVKETFGWELEVVEREARVKGFRADPVRWVVERTFAWLGRNRRLSKDYELRPETSESWVYLAMTNVLLRRLSLTK